MRIAQLLVVPTPSVEVVEVGELPTRARAPAASARRGCVEAGAAHQGLGDSPLAGAHPALPAREARRRALAASRRRGAQRREPDARRSSASSRRRRASIGGGDELPVEGPVAIVDSISPERSLWSKHVVHIVFAGELNGSLADLVSRDEAVRGHRLFELDELEGLALHPPIEPLPAPIPARRSLRLPRSPVGALSRSASRWDGCFNVRDLGGLETAAQEAVRGMVW